MLVGCAAMSHAPQLMLNPDHWGLLNNREQDLLPDKPELDRETAEVKWTKWHGCMEAIAKLRRKLEDYFERTRDVDLDNLYSLVIERIERRLSGLEVDGRVLPGTPAPALPELATEERFKSVGRRYKNRAELYAVLALQSGLQRAEAEDGVFEVLLSIRRTRYRLSSWCRWGRTSGKTWAKLDSTRWGEAEKRFKAVFPVPLPKSGSADDKPFASEDKRKLLRLLAEGRTSREIATELVLSVRTVERHVSNLYTKLNLHSRAQATAFAVRHGLVSE